MQLSIRLSALAQYVEKGSSVIDVGTDHAYIPIHLIEEGKAIRCLATDINAGPLKKADKNIRAKGVKNISLKQTNGLEGVTSKDGDVIMISGMGGYLIIDILERAAKLLVSVNKLILQPQQDIDKVRKYLHRIGFKIETEDFVIDDGKYYTVIVAKPGKEVYDKEYEYVYGKCLIQKKLPVFKEWLVKKHNKLKEISQKLEQTDSPSIAIRKNEIKKEIEMHQEVMTCVL